MKDKYGNITQYEQEITRLKAELRKSKAKVSHVEYRLKELVKPYMRLENLKHEIRTICSDKNKESLEKIQQLYSITLK